MSVYLAGVEAIGGIPLFSRQVGEQQQSDGIPFATLASLNGVNMFARLNEANLLSAVTGNALIHWKVFNKSVVLIMIVTKNSSLEHVEQQVMERTLDYIYDSLVLCCGPEELLSQNVERLKRCLKSAYPLVDHLLRLLVTPATHANLAHGCVNSLYVETHANNFAKALAESYSAVASSDFACILVNGFLVAASKGWWTRLSHSKDAFLVVNLANAISGSFTPDAWTRELAVFLPENCPDTLTRLLVSQVQENVFMVLLCGETPTFQFIEETLAPVRLNDQHQNSLAALAGMRGCSFLPIDERIMCLALLREDRKTLLRYGSFDQRKAKEMTLMLSTIGRTATTPTTTSDGSHGGDQYVRFKHTTAFAVTQSPLTLIVFMSGEHSLQFVRDVSLKTLAQFADRKFLSQFN